MNKKFLFVHFNINTKCDNINHGIAYLIPIVKKHSYDAICLIVDREISPQEFHAKINDFAPSIIGFSSTSHQLKYLARYSKIIGQYSNILQIAGGVGPTLDPEWVLSQSDVKGVCVGEGEIPLESLLSNIKKGEHIANAAGFYWRINGNLKRNPIPQFICDLSLIDFPDYTIYENGVVTANSRLLIQLSRGCPFNCYFCCNAALKNIYSSSAGYYRLPSVDHSIGLLEKMIGQYPESKFIEFEDDLLIANKIWFNKFSEEYKKKIHLPYRMNARVECVDMDIVKALKESGCKKVYLGLESGNEYLRSNLLNKKFSNNLLIEKCKMVKKEELELFTYNIVGFPFETNKEMNDTLELNKKIHPDDGICYFFCPYKGTELYEICKKNGLLKNEDEMLKINNYTTKPCIKMSHKQEKDCIYFQRKISKYFYKCRVRNEIRRIVSDAPPNLKYFLIVVYWLYFNAATKPLLYGIFQKIDTLFGIRKFLSTRRIRESSVAKERN